MSPAESDPLECLDAKSMSTVLAKLTVKERMACSVLNNRWRAFTTQPHFWIAVDLSVAAVGVLSEHAFQSFMLGCAVGISELVLSGQPLTAEFVADCLRSSAFSLSVLTFEGRFMTTMGVAAIVNAAPRLKRFNASVVCGPTAAESVIQREGVFAVVSVRRMRLVVFSAMEGFHATVDEQVALLERLPAYTDLTALEVCNFSLFEDRAMSALADCVCASRITHLSMVACEVLPTGTLDLLRMLPVLTELSIKNRAMRFADAHTAVVLAAALRASSLKQLAACGPSMGDPVVFTSIVDALTGHGTLESLTVGDAWADPHRHMMCASLARLIASDTPALRALTVCRMFFGFSALVRVTEALRTGNTHLRHLCLSMVGVCGDLDAMHLLPAVRACASLVVVDLRPQPPACFFATPTPEAWADDSLPSVTFVAQRELARRHLRDAQRRMRYGTVPNEWMFRRGIRVSDTHLTHNSTAETVPLKRPPRRVQSPAVSISALRASVVAAMRLAERAQQVYAAALVAQTDAEVAALEAKQRKLRKRVCDIQS